MPSRFQAIRQKNDPSVGTVVEFGYLCLAPWDFLPCVQPVALDFLQSRVGRFRWVKKNFSFRAIPLKW